jgi:beta-phosphoglucomutase-like phosphatase (HAD superfamily)
MTFSGVMLDIDGTLVLSNDAQAQAWVEAFTKASVKHRLFLGR